MTRLTDLPALLLVSSALRKDPSLVAAVEGVAARIRRLAAERVRMIIYARIDELPEELLDILAYDMHVEWYQEDQPLEVKRALIKGSVQVHMTKGTPAAVEAAVGAVFPGSRVEEWFEYGGRPYFFRITVGIGSRGSITEALRIVDRTKNLRSWIDGIVFGGNFANQNRFQISRLIMFSFRIPNITALQGARWDGTIRWDGTHRWSPRKHGIRGRVIINGVQEEL